VTDGKWAARRGRGREGRREIGKRGQTINNEDLNYMGIYVEESS
jgi:hypothetical protein